MDKFRVTYNTKSIDRMSNVYNLLIEKHSEFDSLQGAIKFARQVMSLQSQGVTLVGKPVIDRVQQIS